MNSLVNIVVSIIIVAVPEARCGWCLYWKRFRKRPSSV